MKHSADLTPDTSLERINNNGNGSNLYSSYSVRVTFELFQVLSGVS